MRKVYRRLGAKALGATLLVSVFPSAFAVVLAPGESAALNGLPLTLTTSLLVTTPRDWIISTPQGPIKGHIDDQIFRDSATETLDFAARLFVDEVPTVGKGQPGPFSGVVFAARSIYSNFATDVDFDGVSTGGTAPTEASRTTDGSAVTFLFGDQRVTPADLPAGGSKLFYIKTNAKAYDALGYLNVGSNEGNSPNFTTWFNVYQPVPEPGIWGMLLAGVMGVVGIARRRLPNLT